MLATLAVCLTLVVSAVHSPQPGSIQGVVAFEDVRQPASGAAVRIAGTQFGTIADADGKFVVGNLAEGTYEVEISFVGYKRERLAEVRVTAGDTTSVFVILKPSPFNLDEVVVTGNLTKHILKDAPVLTEVIGSKELSVIGSKNLSEVLQSQTGIDVGTGIGQTQNVSLHGLNDNHVLILVDGERVSGKVDGAIDLGQVPVSMVKKVEVVKGPLSSIYGSDAIGGVVNILTKSPEESELTASVVGGMLGRGEYTLGGTHTFANLFGERTSLGFVGNISLSKFGGVDYNLADNFMEMPSSERKNLNLKSVARLSEFFTVELKADAYRDNLEWRAGDVGITYLDDFSENNKVSLSVSGTYVPSDEFSLKLSSHKSQNDRRSWEYTGAGFLTRDSYSREIVQTHRAQATFVPYKNSILTTGVEYNREDVSSSRFSRGLSTMSNNVAYVEDEWNVGFGTLAIGGRYNDNSVFGSVVAPRISAMIPVTDHTTVRASYGRGYREPSLLELYIDFDHSTVGYIVRGEPTLKPEDSQGFNLGVQYNREDLVWFRFTYFYNSLNNLIDYYFAGSSNGAAVLSYRNVERATTQGIDVDADFGVTDALGCSVGYNLVSAKDGYDNPLPFRAPHSANLKVNYALPWYGAKADVRVRWYDTKPVNNDQTDRGIYSQGVAPVFSYVSAYSVTDLRLSAAPFSGVEVFLGINNLFDVRLFPFGQVKPLEVFGGVNVSLK